LRRRWRKVLKRFNLSPITCGYGSLGREEEARAAAAEVLRIDPKFSVEHFAKRLPYKKQIDKDRFIGGLGKAGLK
jgi:hypothetical protein